MLLFCKTLLGCPPDALEKNFCSRKSASQLEMDLTLSSEMPVIAVCRGSSSEALTLGMLATVADLGFDIVTSEGKVRVP